jgi:cytochrome bd-type quinol oxidase subunit 2
MITIPFCSITGGSSLLFWVAFCLSAFVQGGQSMIFSLSKTEDEKRLLVNVLGENGNILLQRW